MIYLQSAVLRQTGIDNTEHFPSLHCVPQFTRHPGKESRQAAAELSNEVLCCWLGNKIGLPMDTWRAWKGGEADQLPAEPGLWFNEYKPFVSPVVRSCYASWRSPEMGPMECYEIIPSKWQARVSNREDFIGMVMFDLWAGAQRYRQALYVGRPDDRLRALFLSHGKMFHGLGKIPDGRQLSNLETLVAAHRHALSSWTESAIANWAGKLESLHGHSIEQAFDYARAQWQPEGWEESVREYLALRHDEIPLIAEAVLSTLRNMCARCGAK